MWHVDDGTLHAYLDERERPGAGALDAVERERVEQHVAACATCAARLADETRVRAAAAGILAASAPRELAVPDFPASVAAATAPKRVATWRRLAWAATLVMAVGAGWFGSELWRSRPTERTVRQEAAVEETEQEARQSAAAVDLGAPQGDPASPAAGSGAAADPAAGRSGVEPAERAGAVASIDPPVAADVAAAPEVARAENRAESAQAQARPAVTEPPLAPEQMAAAKRAAPPAAAPAAAPLVPTGAMAGAARLVESREQQRAPALEEFRSRAAAPVSWPEHGYPGDADVAWIPLVPELAMRILRDSLYVLPEAGLVRLALSSDGTRVLMVQRLAADLEVELVQWRAQAARVEAQADAAAKAAGSPTARDGRAFVVVQRGGVSIALKAPAGASAAALAGRLERSAGLERRP